MSKIRVELIDHMGSDLAVVNAARVSFNSHSAEFTDRDERLIHYLAANHHWTPFAHTAITLRVGAPVPIRTQCFKHKQGFVENEESRRYISAAPEVFVPDEWRTKPGGGAKQGSGDRHPGSDFFHARYLEHTTQAVELYRSFIEEGVCPEQARFLLPQGVMVNWIWTGSLAGYARFYSLRSDPHAQREVRNLAAAVGTIVEPLFPVSWAALAGVV